MTETSVISSLHLVSFSSTPGSSFSQCRHCKDVLPLFRLYVHVCCIVLLSLKPGGFLLVPHSPGVRVKEQLCHKGALDKHTTPPKKLGCKQEASLQENI